MDPHVFAKLVVSGGRTVREVTTFTLTASSNPSAAVSVNSTVNVTI